MVYSKMEYNLMLIRLYMRFVLDDIWLKWLLIIMVLKGWSFKLFIFCSLVVKKVGLELAFLKVSKILFRNY